MLRQLFRRRPPELAFTSETPSSPSEDHQEEGLNVKDPIKKGRGRGFGGASASERREIAARGGKTSQANGTAHKWTSAEASAAGKKSGEARARKHKKAS